MSNPTQTFSLGNSQIAECVWTCVVNTSMEKEHTVYNPAPPPIPLTGTSSTPAAGTHVNVNFTVDLSAATVTYEITYHHFPVTVAEIWNGIRDMINGYIQQCSSS